MSIRSQKTLSRTSSNSGVFSNVFKRRGIETLSQSTSRRRAPNFFATYTNAHRRNAEFFRITRKSGSRASGSSGRRISMTCCGFTDRGTSRTIRYGSVCTPTLCPNRALMSDEMSCARVSLTFDPKHAFTIRTSRADSVVSGVSVASGAWPTDARYSRNVFVPCSLTGYGDRSRSLRMRPTSWATSNGTGMSSPTHEGTSPISRTGSTRIWSSLKSTNRQAEPRMMKLSPSFAFSATNHSSRVPIARRDERSITRYVFTSGIIEMFSKKYGRELELRPSRPSRDQRIRRPASWATTSSKSARFNSRNGQLLRKVSYASSSEANRSDTAWATSWFARTERLSFRTTRSSISSARARRAIAHASATSSSWVARITPSETSPTPCPDRPIRCTSRDTSRGELYCKTKSAVPTSIPSSRDDVQTRARRPPDLNSSSIWTRTSFERLPWCTPIFGSWYHAASRDDRNSAVSRVFTKNNVDWCSLINS